MGQVQARGQELVAVQEPVGGEDLQNMMDEDSGAGKQDQRERELQHDEDSRQSAPAMPANAACAVLEDLIQIEFGRAQSRHDAEEHAARDAENGEIGEDG